LLLALANPGYITRLNLRGIRHRRRSALALGLRREFWLTRFYPQGFELARRRQHPSALIVCQILQSALVVCRSNPSTLSDEFL